MVSPVRFRPSPLVRTFRQSGARRRRRGSSNNGASLLLVRTVRCRRWNSAFGDKRGISPSAAEALYALTDGFIAPAEFLSVFLFIPAGLVAIRARVLPVRLGVITLLLAALLLVLPIGFVGIIFLMPLWTVVTAIVLVLRARTTALS